MRIAVLIIALCLTALVGVQSCTVMVGGGVERKLGIDDSSGAKSKAQDMGIEDAGAMGVMVAVLYVVGAAFALGVPRLSMIVFALAAAIGFMAGSESEFTDMSIWGSVALILAVMSYLGFRELRKKQKSAPGGE